MVMLESVDTAELLSRTWQDYEPEFARLAEMEITSETVDDFLSCWTRLTDLLSETEQRLQVACSVNTADEESQGRLRRYLDEIFPAFQTASQELKQRLLNSGVTPAGFETPLQRMRAQAELFRDENVPLLADEQKLALEYQEISGAQTIEWQGHELPLPMIGPILQDPDRGVREQVWRLSGERQLQDRQKLDDLWRRMLDVRLKLAANTGMNDYREYRWRELLRFDYTPEHNKRFHRAVKDVAVPAYRRLLEERRQSMKLDILRPWDLRPDPEGRPPLHPFEDVSDLVAGTARIFHRVDPALGSHFDEMAATSLLDLASRKNKGPGGYCTSYSAIRKPFIFMNAAGVHNDVQTLLHEGGHAFHVFETGSLPYHDQREVPTEFAEVASMSMELLAAPYLPRSEGGFYTDREASRARIEALERMIQLWVTVTQTDEFQHWVYEHPDDARDGARCDETWLRLAEEYVPSGVDWTGLDNHRADGWRRILHIFIVPFYVIEYCLAQLAAVQLWSQARQDQAGAVSRYRQALALGGTRSLPALYEAVGAKFDFGESTLAPAIELIEQTLKELRPIAAKG